MMDYNRKVIKETFENNVNKQAIYNNIINKANNNYINYLKISLVPICMIIAIIFTVNIINKDDTNMRAENENQNIISDTNILSDEKNSIYLNNFEFNDYTSYDIGGISENVKFLDIVNEVKTIGKIKFPKGVKETRCLKEYDFKNSSSTTIKKSSQSNLDKGDFRGYDIMFYDENHKGVDIFVSQTLKQRLRCTRVYLEDFKASKILGKEVMILTYYNNKNFIVLFEHDNLYWDIEAHDVTQDELITLIESIIGKESE